LLVALSLALGARDIPGWSPEEEALLHKLPPVPGSKVESFRQQILDGNDPLGELFCVLRSPAERRRQGATFTPIPIINAMVDWAERHGSPSRIIDPGAGSARFAVLAGRRFPNSSIIGTEIDPLPAILARANLATAGLAQRSRVILGDFREVRIEPIEGRTLYIGNPPYVRHHVLEPCWKQWLISEAAKRGLSASQLAGLHVHFFLATAIKSQRRDFGVFITASEWLDVNYGSLVRELLLGELGGRRIVVIEPTALPFPDAATTAVISAFDIGTKAKTIHLKRVERLSDLNLTGNGRVIRRERIESERRWSHLTRPTRTGPTGYIELGELCRVHRGQVTGANRVWIEGQYSIGLPESVLFPTVTKAKELFKAGKVLTDSTLLRRVIDLPHDLDVFADDERKKVDRFLTLARRQGAHQSYVATNRKAWWSVGLRDPAPILATYMARRPPAFVQNEAEARHINIAHGLYPREPLPTATLRKLAEYLSNAVSMTEGRTYAGGLTKFEPREMERLLVPGLELLSQTLP
jgi:adenine-specific DNA-methyltransferase